MGKWKAVALAAATACALALSAAPAMAAGGARLFVSSAHENGDGTVMLRLYRGESQGRTVYFTVLDASASAEAAQYGVNRSNKLANAAGSVAVQRVSVLNGVIHFPATVDFSPEHIVVPGPAGFPPAAFQPGAVGEAGYSPLIQLPNGVILNAPHLANDTGVADKVVSIDYLSRRARFEETAGFSNGRRVLYVSTDASDPLAAALENATFAPQLNFAPGLGDDSTASARAELNATINGQTGAGNPNRQGFTSALLDGLSPLNVLAWTPNQGRYSPLWDVHLALWSDAAVAARRNVALKNVADTANAARAGDITAPDGSPFGASNIVVNCPIISARE